VASILKKISIFSLFVLLLSSCNTWVGKQYVNTVTRYNRLYLAKEKVADTDRTIKTSYPDDFNKILPVFNYGDESSLKGNGGKMDEVLKKTSHIVDKYPKSKWADDAWFVMGQSYFYRGDFFAAIETFEFVSTKYKKTKMAYNANLWTLYSYILLDKQSESLAIINKLKSEKQFPKEYKKGLFLSASEIAIRQNKPTVAIENLNKALPFLKKKQEKIRFNYILAQLYESVDSFEKASKHYRKVIKYNPPYEFNFNAQINMASALVSGNNKSPKKAKSVLKKMLKDDKNLEYFSKIYFELGKIENLGGSPANAITYYQTSLRSRGSNDILKTNAYNAIGDIYFGQHAYIQAQNYFDSANVFLQESHPQYEILAKKRTSQSELVKNLVTLQTNDSLLDLASNASKLERIIDQKILDEERKKRQEEAQIKAQSNKPPPMLNSGFGNNNNNNVTAAASTSFPFYDATQRGKGYADFVGKWGDRKLGDNWNVKSIATASPIDPLTGLTKETDTATKETKVENEAPKNPIEARKKYYEAIPYTDDAKKALNTQNVEALFNLGIIHIYEIGDEPKGVSYLEQLLNRYPNNQFEPRTYYELAKLAKKNKQTAVYDKYFSKLDLKYPNSNYLKVLKNELIAESDQAKNGVSQEVQVLYKTAFQAYKKGQYDSVLMIKSIHDKKYAGNPLQANFDYLAALTYGKKGDLKEYENRLKAIIADYPNTSVGSNATQNLFFMSSTVSDTSKNVSTIIKYSFISNKNLDHFTVFYLPMDVQTEKIKSALNDYHSAEYSLKIIEVTEVVIETYKCILVKGFNNIKDNVDYMNVITQKGILRDYDKDLSKTIIHQQNLQIILKENNLSEYLKFAKKEYFLR